MHRFELRVRYGDTDQMGFAYYGNYLRWFEIGRAEMLRALGTSYREVEDAGISLPVLEAWCHYREPARYDDLLTIETGVLECGRASVRFGYRVMRGATSLATGFTEHCFMNRDGRPARPPAALGRLLASAPAVPPGLGLPRRHAPPGTGAAGSMPA
jgi:acyl-CoA thioester hydrolase